MMCRRFPEAGERDYQKVNHENGLGRDTLIGVAIASNARRLARGPWTKVVGPPPRGTMWRVTPLQNLIPTRWKRGLAIFAQALFSYASRMLARRWQGQLLSCLGMGL